MRKGLDAKYEVNIFTDPEILKSWSIDMSEACGSILINKKPNVSKIDKLIEVFVNHYNDQMDNREVIDEDTPDMYNMEGQE